MSTHFTNVFQNRFGSSCWFIFHFYNIDGKLEQCSSVTIHRHTIHFMGVHCFLFKWSLFHVGGMPLCFQILTETNLDSLNIMQILINWFISINQGFDHYCNSQLEHKSINLKCSSLTLYWITSHWKKTYLKVLWNNHPIQTGVMCHWLSPAGYSWIYHTITNNHLKCQPFPTVLLILQILTYCVEVRGNTYKNKFTTKNHPNNSIERQ